MDVAKTILYFIYWVTLLTGACFIFFEVPIIGDYIRLSLMPILLFYLLANVKPTHSQKLKIFFFLAFTLSWVGDILKVMLTNTNNTIDYNKHVLLFCLSSYTIANVFNILAFYKIRPLKLSKAVPPSITFILGATTIYLVFFKFISKGIIGNFKAPFIIYLSGMFAVAAFASNILDSNSRKKLAVSYFIPAAILTIFSAAMFALNKYKILEPKLDSVVLLTYGYAQILYVDGFRKTAR